MTGPEQVASVALVTGIAKQIRLETDAHAHVEVSVIDGGPVFVWWNERLTDDEAQKRSALGADFDVDLAVNDGQSRSSFLAGGMGVATLIAEADTRVLIQTRVIARHGCGCRA